MKIEIWSDVVCPWCYIGKRRFETALADFPHRDEVEVVWRSFELDPHAPQERPETTTEHLVEKFGATVAQAEAMQARAAEVAAAEGLELRFDLARGGNTLPAHRLIHLAAEHGLAGEVTDRLMRAFFTEGERIGDGATLARLATEAGLPAEEVEAVLASDRYADAVHGDEHQAHQLGATGVPFFLFDGRYGVSGAQGTDVFAAALKQAFSA
jgi:predicted DsbA family dithiol-disulfide isomerase